MQGIKIILAAFCLLAACWLVPFAAIANDDGPNIDPKADTILRQMCDYMAHQKHFIVKAETTHESILDNGEKLMFLNQVTVYLKRPDKIYSYRKGMVRNQEIFYDGKKLTLYSKGLNLWASTPAPSTIDKAMDFAISELGLSAPGGDLFYSDAYKGLMEDVISGAYIGENEVGGIPCYHLAFRGADVDWQIWVQKGDKPLPRKYVIISKWTTGAPEYTMTIKQFDASTPIPDERFNFIPPKGASRIAFALHDKIKSVLKK